MKTIILLALLIASSARAQLPTPTMTISQVSKMMERYHHCDTSYYDHRTAEGKWIIQRIRYTPVMFNGDTGYVMVRFDEVGFPIVAAWRRDDNLRLGDDEMTGDPADLSFPGDATIAMLDKQAAAMKPIWGKSKQRLGISSAAYDFSTKKITRIAELKEGNLLVGWALN